MAPGYEAGQFWNRVVVRPCVVSRCKHVAPGGGEVGATCECGGRCAHAYQSTADMQLCGSPRHIDGRELQVALLRLQCRATPGCDPNLQAKQSAGRAEPSQAGSRLPSQATHVALHHFLTEVILFVPRGQRGSLCLGLDCASLASCTPWRASAVDAGFAISGLQEH